MARRYSFGKLPSATLNLAAGMAMLAGLFALGVGIGSGSTPLLIAAYAVIFLAALVPAAVDLRDSKRRPEPTSRPEAVPAAAELVPEWDMEKIEQKTGGLVWIEPQADGHRLH